MTFARFSIAGLLWAVGLCAVGMACLMFASTPWAGAVLSVTLGILTLALLGLFYRRGERRAFWVGFVLCGWSYMTLSCGPGFIGYLRPQLVTSKLLVWAYPLLIPRSRQTENTRTASRPFVVQSANLEGGLTVDDLSDSLVDVWVRGEDDTVSWLLLKGVQSRGRPTPGAARIRVTLMTDAGQFAKLTRAKTKSPSLQVILRRHSASPFAPLWANPPVNFGDFEDVGHCLFGLLSAWIGSSAGRYFFATRTDAVRAGPEG
jgi:hypothetical protein